MSTFEDSIAKIIYSWSPLTDVYDEAIPYEELGKVLKHNLELYVNDIVKLVLDNFATV